MAKIEIGREPICKRCETESDFKAAIEDKDVPSQERVVLIQDLRADLVNLHPIHARKCSNRKPDLDLGSLRTERFDPNSHDLNSVTRSVRTFFDGVAHDLGVEDITDDASIDLIRDTLSDRKVPSDMIDDVISERNLYRTWRDLL
jgi:hypothetical protein